jgi:hypothetical protein
VDELQNRVLKCGGIEVIRLSSGLVLGNALVLSCPANFRVVGYPEAAVNLWPCGGYAASRISSNLNGRTSKFGWLQAPATARLIVMRLVRN